jgi:hypothetical protein
MNMPVIIIHERYNGISNFLNEIQHDFIVFFDEYEKMYDERDHSILTVMDGVLNNAFRKIFLLTTNKIHVSENMLERPGRIRYFS